MITTKVIEIPVDITIEDAANVFIEADGINQAILFNKIASKIKTEWDRGIPDIQICEMITKGYLTKDAIDLIRMMAEYTYPINNTKEDDTI